MSTQEQTLDANQKNQLQIMLIEKEYEYLTQSSFHSDGLRNQIIQFYLVLVGGAATALVGLAQLESKNNIVINGSHIQSWILSTVALFIGLVGMCMVPIFARLRNNVLECLQGTVLLKRFVYNKTVDADDLPSAMLWDARSLPHDEKYVTASFILVFIFMMLDSGMVGLAFLLWHAEATPVTEMSRLGWQSIAVGILFVTFQVIFYRAMLYHAIKTSLTSNRLEEKFAKLDQKSRDEVVVQPQWGQPIMLALVLGVIAFVAALLISVSVH